MEINQHLTVPRQKQRTTTPSFAKKWRLMYNHWRKRSYLESTTSQQNWSRQAERMWSPHSRQSATRSGRQENGQPCGPSPWSSHFPRKATSGSARTTERSASPVIQAVTLMIILNRLKPQAEEIIAEERVGFRAGRSTTEKIFNLRLLCKKYLQHQQDL